MMDQLSITNKAQIKTEKLQIENRKFKMQIDVLKKHHEIERSWLK